VAFHLTIPLLSILILSTAMKDAYALVAHIIREYGPRRAGSDAETGAQLYLATVLRDFCDRVDVEPFRDALTAKFSSLRLFCLAYWTALLMPMFSTTGAFLLATANGLLFLGHFVMYRNWLDFLYPVLESRNVVGTIEPSGEVRRTVIFSGHMDSTPEFIWWYRLKNWGIRLMVLGGVSFALLPLYLGISLAFGLDVWGSPVWWVFAATSPFALTFFFIHGKKVVDGAQDNLSGVAVACAIGKQLSENRLRHTLVRVVSFGSEETGLRGSAAYVRTHWGDLRSQPHHIINLDGILDIDNMHIVTSEPSIPARHDADLNGRLVRAFEANGLPPKLAAIPVGATDAASFSRRGIPATSIVGLPMDRLHPTYHTRLDTIDCLDPVTLERMADILADMTRKWDEEA